MLGYTDADIQAALVAAGTPDGKNGAGIIGAGTKMPVKARFYMHATIDGDATQKNGRNIYREVPYVEIRPLGEDGRLESMSRIVTDAERREFPQEWAAFERQRTTPMHSVMALPGFNACAFRYCDDAQLFTIEALSVADVQPELEALKAEAVRWMEFAYPKPKKAGRPPGSRNKPKVDHGKDAESAA